MTLRVLHVLDHSVPLHSDYAFRTLAILAEQKKEPEASVITEVCPALNRSVIG